MPSITTRVRVFPILLSCVLDFDISLEWFEQLVKVDPYRLENMDTYSNILYIKENHGNLANLALRCFNNNKYFPETCCVVGMPPY